jgi:hypothetical protein
LQQEGVEVNMKYRVYGNMTVGLSIEVEADNEDEAIDAADDLQHEAAVFVGNGSQAGLVGLEPRESTLEFDACDCYPEWAEAVAGE